MKKKTALAIVALMLAAALSLVALTACVNDETPAPDNGAYEIPADLNIGVSFFNGDANNLLGMVTKTVLADKAQSLITVDNVQYAAYKVSDLTAGFNMPDAMSTVKLVTVSESEKEIVLTSFADSYIAIGIVADGKLNASDAPYFVVNASASSADNVISGISKVYIDPVMGNAPSVIPEAEEFDMGLISISEITVSVGNEALFTFKKSDLAALDQYLLTLTAENKKYVGFKFTEIAEAKGATLPESFTTVKAGTMEKDISSLENAYVVVRKADDPTYEELNNIPRFVFDYATVTDMNSDVAKTVTAIIIDPEESEAPAETLLAELTLGWDGLNLTIELDDITGITTDGTIMISTSAVDGSVTSLSVGTQTVVGHFPGNALVTKSTNKDGNFYGYTLNDVLSCLGKINNKGEFKAAEYSVSLIKFTVAENGENVLSSTVVEAADFDNVSIINYTKETPPTRVYLASGNVKNVVKISLYSVAE